MKSQKMLLSTGKGSLVQREKLTALKNLYWLLLKTEKTMPFKEHHELPQLEETLDLQLKYKKKCISQRIARPENAQWWSSSSLDYINLETKI